METASFARTTDRYDTSYSIPFHLHCTLLLLLVLLFFSSLDCRIHIFVDNHYSECLLSRKATQMKRQILPSNTRNIWLRHRYWIGSFGGQIVTACALFMSGRK